MNLQTWKTATTFELECTVEPEFDGIVFEPCLQIPAAISETFGTNFYASNQPYLVGDGKAFAHYEYKTWILTGVSVWKPCRLSLPRAITKEMFFRADNAIWDNEKEKWTEYLRRRSRQLLKAGGLEKEGFDFSDSVVEEFLRKLAVQQILISECPPLERLRDTPMGKHLPQKLKGKS